MFVWTLGFASSAEAHTNTGVSSNYGYIPNCIHIIVLQVMMLLKGNVPHMYMRCAYLNTFKSARKLLANFLGQNALKHV